MTIKTEIYTDENGVERKKDYFGYIDENGNEVITSTWDRPVVELEPVEPEPTEEELAQAEMLLMQSEIIANQNAQDEVLAEILLNQIGG